MIEFYICIALGAICGIVGGVLTSLKKQGKSPFQKGKNANYTYRKNVTHTENKSNAKSKKHSGKCDGDCANCPPHYGYRYGRWYYGHSHTEGCEFGGNKGNGGRD